MELKCYLYPGWEPRIRPAAPRRDWMDDAPESFPYRCLPLAMANSHGWEVLSPCGFEVEWSGGAAPEDVLVRVDEGTARHEAPVALFGLGTFTLHIQGLFRTPPGWNLFVSGPPNTAKDGVAPLAGLIETDWSPYTFTMNWRLTRPGQVVRFEENEPIAFFFPVERGRAAAFEPEFVPIDTAPELKADFEAWSRARDAFQKDVAENPPSKPADKWQKLYYRGLMPDGKCPFPGHESKLSLRDFAHPEHAGQAAQAMQRTPVPRAPRTPASSRPDEAPSAPAPAKLAWVLETLSAQSALCPDTNGIHKRRGLDRQTFLSQHYAASRPVVLAGAVEHWPAIAKWTPEYLAETVGSAEIEFQDERTGDPDFERYKDNHLQRAPFDAFLARIAHEDGNRAYLTAYNAHRNLEALAPLDADIGRLPEFLDYTASLPGGHGGMIWIGPAGTKTSLHHDLTNNFLVQITGRKRVILAAPSETPNLYNDHHVFSQIPDVTDPDLDLARFPRLANVVFHDVLLEPGEVLFIPVGWWHQVEALDFSVSMTFTNFLWRNAW